MELMFILVGRHTVNIIKKQVTYNILEDKVYGKKEEERIEQVNKD